MNDKVLNMKLPQQLYDDIAKIAKENNISVASAIRIALTEYVKKHTANSTANADK